MRFLRGNVLTLPALRTERGSETFHAARYSGWKRRAPDHLRPALPGPRPLFSARRTPEPHRRSRPEVWRLGGWRVRVDRGRRVGAARAVPAGIAGHRRAARARAAGDRTALPGRGRFFGS